MYVSEIPAAFAEVATPILKLWVLYLESSTPVFLNVADMRVLNCALAKGPSL